MVVHHNGARHVWRAVASVPDVRVAMARSVHGMAENLRAPGHLALDRPGVGVQQHLVGVVPQAQRRLPRTVRSHGIPRSGAEPGNGAEPGPVGVVRQGDPALTGTRRVVGVEQGDLHGFRVPGIDGEVHAVAGDRCPERGNEISRGAHGHKRRQSLR